MCTAARLACSLFVLALLLPFKLSAQYLPDINTVALWHFDESSPSDIALDASGNNYHGTPTGTTVVPGKFSLARGFNGNDFIAVPTYNPSGPFTLEAWISTDSTAIVAGKMYPVIDHGVYSQRGYLLTTYGHEGGRVSVTFAANDINGTPVFWVGTDEVGKYLTNLSTFHHIAGTWDGEVARVYVDGVLWHEELGNNTLQIASHGHPIRIGHMYAPTNEYFRGVIDEVRISNKAREPGDFNLRASIQGSVFNDVNANGMREPGESGIPNWAVNLTGTASATILTNANGEYSFTGLDAGNYLVSETLPDRWKQTYPDTPGSYSLTLNSGYSQTNKDFGNRAPYGTTVVVHGYTGCGDGETFDTDQKWVGSMANAIAERLGGGQVYFINDGQVELRNSLGVGTGGESIIAINWMPESNNNLFGYAEATGDALVALLIEGATSNPPHWSLEQLHFIAHSRGTVVASEAIQRLGVLSEKAGTLSPGIVIDQNIHFTILDAHPSKDPLFPNDISNHPVLGFEAHDNKVNGDVLNRGVVCWQNVRYGDNYFHVSNGTSEYDFCDLWSSPQK